MTWRRKLLGWAARHVPAPAWLKRRAIRWMGRGGDVEVEARGIPMLVHANTFETALYVKAFEPYTAELFEQAVRPGAAVVDIGAQFGYFALIAARRGAAVHAFEPEPSNLALLRRNVERNGFGDRIVVVPKAVGARAETLALHLYEGSDSHGLHRHPDATVRGTIDVECVTLDDHLGGRRVDVIKMDIEGHEPFALAGMTRTIAASPGLVLFVEFAPDMLRRAGTEPAAFLDRLAGVGFSMELIDEEARRVRPVDPAESFARGYANLRCVRAGASGP